MTPNDLLASGIRMSTALVHRMVGDLTPAEFLHQPAPGANCAAWIVGHLATTMNRTLGRLGVEGVPSIPEDVAASFQMTKQPAEKQVGLGDPKDLLGLLDDQATRLQAAMLSLPAEPSWPNQSSGHQRRTTAAICCSSFRSIPLSTPDRFQPSGEA
jgi:hypothetical protein